MPPSGSGGLNTHSELYDFEQQLWLGDREESRRGRRRSASPLPRLEDDFDWHVPARPLRHHGSATEARPRSRRVSARTAAAPVDPWRGELLGDRDGAITREEFAALVARVEGQTAAGAVHAELGTEAPPAQRDPAHRRTVLITGRGDDRYVPARARPERSLQRHERHGHRPDRVAMWAVLLGIALLLGAVTSSHAAVLAVHAVPR